MNTGMVVSFIVGGLLLISIITLNARVIENSGETTLNMSAKTTVENVTQIMLRDLLRIGYNTPEEPSKAIKFASSQKFVFEADIDNDNSETPVTITWQIFPGTPVNSTKNPNDFKLTRTVDSGPEQGTITFPVTDFSFSYFNQDRSSTTVTTAIKTIKVSMEAQAPAKYGNRNNYEKAFWNKTFTPPNLNLERYQ